MYIKAPCKDCPERREACWGQCEKYKAYKERVAEIKHQCRLRSEVNQYISDAIKRVRRTPFRADSARRSKLGE